jgi:SH3-like domain-containing protein
VKNAPTDTANEIFTLHEGTKINVLDSVDNWKKIRLADGKIGWVSADALKEI